MEWGAGCKGEGGWEHGVEVGQQGTRGGRLGSRAKRGLQQGGRVGKQGARLSEGETPACWATQYPWWP